MNVKQELKSWLNIKELDIESESILDEGAVLLSEWLIAHVRKKQENYPDQRQFMEQLPSLTHLVLKFMLKEFSCVPGDTSDRATAARILANVVDILQYYEKQDEAA